MSDSTPIVDMSFALSQLSGNQALVEQLFSRFQQDYQSASATLDEQLPNVDVASAKALVHTIKGVAGNLGLKQLHLAAKALEDAIKANSQIEQRKTEFDQVLQATFDEMNAVVSSEPVESNAPVTATMDASAAKKTLAGMLARHEFIPPDKLAELLSSLDTTEQNKQAIEEAISDLDYDEAASLLGAM